MLSPVELILMFRCRPIKIELPFGFVVASFLGLRFSIVVLRLNRWICLEYNLPMSSPGDGFSRSVRSLDIRVVVDRIPRLPGQLMRMALLGLRINDCNRSRTYV